MHKIISLVSHGLELEGVLDYANSACCGYVIFAHCFTGNKNNTATQISNALVADGFGVLHIDCIALGANKGKFIIAAADFLGQVQKVL